MMPRKKAIPCEYCDGHIRTRLVTDNHWSGNRLVIIEKVPVGVCGRCGERYYDAAVLRTMERIAADHAKIKRKIQVPIVKFQLPA